MRTSLNLEANPSITPPANWHRAPSAGRRLHALVILAWLAVARAWAADLAEPASRQGEPARLGLVPWIGNAPFFIVQEKGFSAQEGFAVGLSFMDDSALARGQGLPLIGARKLDESFGSSDLVAGRPVPMQADKPSADAQRTGDWHPVIDPQRLARRKGVYFVPGLRGFPQTTDYTCGPAALLALAAHYRVPSIATNRETELRIAREAGTRFPENLPPGGKLGTKPDEMARWLEQHGFRVKVEYESAGDGSALRRLRQNLEQGLPTLVEWADLGGHWVVAVGYDTRGTDDPWDDMLIFADSYDRYDDHPDGYTFINANRFYWLWYDAFYFDQLTWRTMITATPLNPRPTAPPPAR